MTSAGTVNVCEPPVKLNVVEPVVAVKLTVIIAVIDPVGPVAVSTYVGEDEGLTLTLPLLHGTVPTPLLIEQLVALRIPLQESVVALPIVIDAGFATKVSMPTAVNTVTAQVAVVPRVTVTV